MRKTIIALTVAFVIVAPGLKDRSFAVENAAKNSAAERKGGSALLKAEDTKTVEAQKAEEEKMASEEAKNNIVARVNGADINMFMLVRAMNMVASKYIKEGEKVSPETTLKIRKEALDRLIFEELAVQEAIRQGINPTPGAIDKVVAQVRKNVGTEEAYQEYLEKVDLTEDTLKKLIERSQRYELITAREVYGNVKIDDKLLMDEYEKEKGKYILPDNFVADDVFLLQGKDEATAQKKADELLKSIRKNSNDVWKLVLDGSFIVRKINIRQEKNPELYKAARDMKAGDLSGIIKDKDGFHIIKLIKKEPSRQLTFEEAKSAIETKFLLPAQEQRKKDLEKELRKDAVIEIMSGENIN